MVICGCSAMCSLFECGFESVKLGILPVSRKAVREEVLMSRVLLWCRACCRFGLYPKVELLDIVLGALTG